MSQPFPSAIQTLSQPARSILISLSRSEKSGYAILRDTAAYSQGGVRMSTGALYEALWRLLEAGLVERIAARGLGEPAAVYRLTRSGRQIVELESWQAEIRRDTGWTTGEAWHENKLSK